MATIHNAGCNENTFTTKRFLKIRYLCYTNADDTTGVFGTAMVEVESLQELTSRCRAARSEQDRQIGLFHYTGVIITGTM